MPRSIKPFWRVATILSMHPRRYKRGLPLDRVSAKRAPEFEVPVGDIAAERVVDHLLNTSENLKVDVKCDGELVA